MSKPAYQSVDLLELKKALNYLWELNDRDLNTLIISDGFGNMVHPSMEQLEHWDFTGLSNVDFLETLMDERHTGKKVEIYWNPATGRLSDSSEKAGE